MLIIPLYLPFKEVFTINYFKFIYTLVITITILIVFFFIFFIPENNSYIFSIDSSYVEQSIQGTNTYLWPLPNHSYISSYFGRRNSPTAYASSFHKGIDIPAEAGTPIYAVSSGTVTLAKFNGSGGCTVVIVNNNLTFTYCHVSPTFIVCPGQYIQKGDLVAYVGPKNIYGFPENKYRDSSGNPTNGATTGSHLHLSISENGTAVDPLKYIAVP